MLWWMSCPRDPLTSPNPHLWAHEALGDILVLTIIEVSYAYLSKYALTFPLLFKACLWSYILYMDLSWSVPCLLYYGRVCLECSHFSSLLLPFSQSYEAFSCLKVLNSLSQVPTDYQQAWILFQSLMFTSKAAKNNFAHISYCKRGNVSVHWLPRNEFAVVTEGFC